MNAEREEEREIDGIEVKGEKHRAEVSAIREKKDKDSFVERETAKWITESERKESKRSERLGKGEKLLITERESSDFDDTCVETSATWHNGTFLRRLFWFPFGLSDYKTEYSTLSCPKQKYTSACEHLFTMFFFLSFFWGQITNYPIMIQPKFKLSYLKFDNLSL